MIPGHDRHRLRSLPRCRGKKRMSTQPHREGHARATGTTPHDPESLGPVRHGYADESATTALLQRNTCSGQGRAAHDGPAGKDGRMAGMAPGHINRIGEEGVQGLGVVSAPNLQSIWSSIQHWTGGFNHLSINKGEPSPPRGAQKVLARV